MRSRRSRVTRRAQIAGALLVSLATTTNGCAGQSTWSRGGDALDLPAPAISDVAANEGPLAKLAQYDGGADTKFAEPSYQPPRPAGAKKTSLFGNFKNQMSSAASKTKDALTIEPKVVAAPDPVSLSSPAGNVGAELYFASARVHERQGNTAKADELYRKALQEKPNDLQVLLHYARMHDRAGNLETAVGIYRRAIAAHPQEAATFNDLGLCHARQNQLRESTEALQQAVRLNPQSALYRNNFASVLVQMGHTEEALSQLKAVHGPAAGHYNLAYLLHKSGRSPEAGPYARRALELDPNMAPAQRLLAMIEVPAVPQVAANVAPATPSAASVSRNLGFTNTSANNEIGLRAPVADVGPRSLPPVDAERNEDWGEPPTPASLPKLLPPVSAN